MAEFRLGRVKFNWTGDWAVNKSYLIDDIVKFGGNTYVAITNHTSTANISDFYSNDLSNWNVHIEGLEQKGEWSAGVYYRINDLVTFGNVVYRVVTAHTSEGTFIDETKVVEYVKGFKSEGDWDQNSEYQSGDVVNYNGSSYVALSTSLAGFQPPAYLGIATDPNAKWTILSDGLAGAASTYIEGSFYRGDLTQYGGNIYRHKIGVTTNVSPLQVGVGSEGDSAYNGDAVWDLLVKGFNFVGNFSTTFNYHPGHIARYGSDSFISIGNSHTNVIPTAGIGTFWEVLASGDSSAALNTKGDLLTYNGGNTRIGIGSTGYALAVQSNGLPGYEIVGNQTRIYYVDSEDGIDTNNGLAPNLAFKTIKQACVAARPKTNITNMVYTASTGVATVTAPGHGLLNTGTFVQLQDIQFECLSGGNVFNVLGMTFNGAVGIATITAIGLGAAPEIGIGATVRLRNLSVQYTGTARFQHQFKSALDNAIQSGGNYAHTFNSCVTNGVTVVGGSSITPTGATYDATSGNFVMTLAGHSLSTSDKITIADNAFTFTCTMNNNATQKTYPRPGKDPAQGQQLNITGTTTNTFTVNVGTSPIVDHKPTAVSYNQDTGDMVCTIGAHSLTVGTSVRLETEGMTFRCSMDGYTTDHPYPRQVAGDGSPDPAYNTALNITAVTTNTITINVGTGAESQSIIGKFPAVHTQGSYEFNVTAVPDANSIALNVGVSTIAYAYQSGGTAFVGLTTTKYPDKVSKSYYEVLEVPDTDNFKTNVGISSINHTYVEGGQVTDLTPAILKLSASQFYEQLPITVPPFTSIIGNALRASQVLPKDATSDDSVTPNRRSHMFKMSDATTIQAISMKGMEGFHYDPNAPLVLDNANLRTGIGTTAAGVFISLNPDSPINNKSPYVKDCTCFSDPATESGRFGGGAVGVFIDGGVHDVGAKSMVFDAFTHVCSDGAGFILDKGAISEIVSCFTYYAKWGYYSGGGSRIRGVGGNNSYGDYGVISSGFSTDEVPRTATVFGDMASVNGVSKAGTLAIGATMFGQTSKASAWFLNDQITADKIYFKYQPGYGNAGIGTTGFVDGEIIWFGAGAEASSGVGSITVGAAASSVTGQKGTIMEVDNISSSLLVGDAIGFTTTLYGATDRFFIINTITNVAAAQTYIAWRAGSQTGLSTVYYNRATLSVSPEKATGTWDTRNLGSGNGSQIEVRTLFSQARLTGHDFLAVGTGNKTETGYPNVNLANVIQGNETNVFGPGKVFFVSTDQGGNFRVGDFFSVDQLTGRATLDASAFNLSGLTELRLGSLGGQVGEAISEFSSDPAMSGNSNSACPTEFAVKGFITRGSMGTKAMTPPVGTTAQRPGGIDDEFNTGCLRFNTTLGALEYYNGTTWIQPGVESYSTVNSSFSAEVGKNYFVNTNGGGVTATLPASPDLGAKITFYDVAKTFDSNALTVSRNGKPIQGDNANLTVNTEGAAFSLVFSGDTYGWRIFSI
jgi:hypothetical protein